MKAIVTVKIEVEKTGGEGKMCGVCPAKADTFCTDVEGKHHSLLIEVDTNERNPLEKVREVVREKFEHITRIEVIED